MYNCIFLIGPTASGKSSIALKFCDYLKSSCALSSVIINGDSMQVYGEVKILTSMPSAVSFSRARHKLYGYVSARDDYNVSIWLADVMREIDLALAQNKVPIICGGTGLYASALCNGLSQIPPIDASIRLKVRGLQKSLSKHEFYELLVLCDPDYAKKLDFQNSQRIARALEVVYQTSRSLSYFHKKSIACSPSHVRTMVISVLPHRHVLHSTISARFDEMLLSGALDEVRYLQSLGLSNDNQLMRAIGIRQFLNWDGSDADLAVCTENSKIATRQYAKRQITYIKRQLDSKFTLGDILDVDDNFLERLSSHLIQRELSND